MTFKVFFFFLKMILIKMKLYCWDLQGHQRFFRSVVSFDRGRLHQRRRVCVRARARVCVRDVVTCEDFKV